MQHLCDVIYAYPVIRVVRFLVLGSYIPVSVPYSIFHVINVVKYVLKTIVQIRLISVSLSTFYAFLLTIALTSNLIADLVVRSWVFWVLCSSPFPAV